MPPIRVQTQDLEKGGSSSQDEACSPPYKSPDIEKDALSIAEFEAIESPISDNSSTSSSSQREPVSRHTSASSKKSTSRPTLTRLASRLTTSSLPEPGPPPDGGLTAWSQCFLTWLVVFNTWGFVNSFGAFQTYYTSTLNLPQSTISWIGSTQAWLMFFLGAFSGRAFDAGLLRPVIILGIIVLLVGMFCMSLSTQYWQLFITQGLLTGMGGGIFFCPSMGLLSTYFSKHRGIAVGISTTGNSAGGIILPLIVRQLLPKVGFAWTVRVLAFVNLASLAVVVAFMKPRLPPRKAGPIFEWSAVYDIPYVLFVAGVCFLMGGVYFTFYYIGSFARNVIGLPYSQSVNLVILLNGIGIPARVLPGLLSDRYGVLNVFLTALSINVIMLFCWPAIPSNSATAFYVWTVIYGLAAAAFQSLFPTAIASLSDDITKTGTRLGMAFSAIGCSALVGGPIGGALLQVDGGKYLAPQLWAAVSTLVGMLLVVGTRIKKNGWKFRTKC